MNNSCVINICFVVKQKTSYELRISDWSADVCSSDLDLPVAVGFGIKTPAQAAEVAAAADAAVVGSALVARIAENLDASGKPKPGLVDAALDLVRGLDRKSTRLNSSH